jgi:hypothetical protein
MNKFLGSLALLVAIAMPAFAQQPGRLSPDDQREFDKYYTRQVLHQAGERHAQKRSGRHCERCETPAGTHGSERHPVQRALGTDRQYGQ